MSASGLIISYPITTTVTVIALLQLVLVFIIYFLPPKYDDFLVGSWWTCTWRLLGRPILTVGSIFRRHSIYIQEPPNWFPRTSSADHTILLWNIYLPSSTVTHHPRATPPPPGAQYPRRKLHTLVPKRFCPKRLALSKSSPMIISSP